MPFRHATDRTRRAWMLGVLLAFVLAQCLGLMHRVVHAPGAGLAAAHAGFDAPRAEGSWVKSLFAGHDSERACDLFDQAGHADVAFGDLPCLEFEAPVMVATALHPGWQLAAQAAGFLARGPPARV